MSLQLNRRLRAPIALLGAVGLLVAAAPPERRGAVTDHVIVVSLDGLRPDAIDAFDLRTLQRLMREGSYTLEAQTITPSKTLPSHTSMLTGVAPELHGITWNSDQTEAHGLVQVPTIFDVAHRAGFGTAAFFSKSKFHHLEVPGSLDYAQAPDGAEHWMATRTVGDAVNYLKHERPNLMFVHLGEADYAGHSVGWMSRIYGWAARRADGGVAAIIEAADRAFGRGEYTLIVTSDHGGHGRDHGTSDPQDMTIPWLVWGEGVQAGVELPAGVRTMDTAATALWLLGLAEPQPWQGAPVAAAFTPAARLAATAARGAVTTPGLADAPVLQPVP